MNDTVKFASDVSELKKVFAAGGALVAIGIAAVTKKNILMVALGKLSVLTALTTLKIPEILPEILDLQEAEALELVQTFYANFI